MTTLQSFKETLFNHAKQMGFEAVEIYYQKNKEFSTKIFRTEVEKYQISEEAGISIRGSIQGKMGYFYSEKLDEAIIPQALESIKAHAMLLDVQEESIVISQENLEDDADNKPLSDHREIVDELISSESMIKKAYAEVDEVPYNLYADVESETIILNTHGLSLRQQSRLFYFVVSTLARRGERSKTAMRLLVGSGEASGFKKAAQEAAEESIFLLDAVQLTSGVYDVILRNDVASEILEAFMGMFSAEAVDKGISLLKDKIGERVAADCVTLVDDPFCDGAPIHRLFDDEGTLTSSKKMIDQGKLIQYLHNSKTAVKMGVSPTGNAYRSGIKSMMGISHTNMYIEKGIEDYESLLMEMERGLVIIDVQALHSGLNPISGDFSLPVQALKIEKGLVVGTVDQITISGNVMEMFKSVFRVANDLKFHFPNGMGSVGSPSLLIKAMNISGK
jgi:PmbA protein